MFNSSIEVDELPTFDEVGACGTVAVITPITEIVDGVDSYRHEAPGPVTRLYDRLIGIQCGAIEDSTAGYITSTEHRGAPADSRRLLLITD